MNKELDCVLGVDPGLSGALTLLSLDKTTLQIFDMPTYIITKNKKKKRQIDLYALARWIDNISPRVKMALVEQVSAMPGQGVTSSFSFGFSCGVVQAMIAANFIPISLVHPKVWKKEMRVTKDKDSSRLAASNLFPKYSHNWARVKDDGRAESLLLAEYMRQVTVINAPENNVTTLQ